MSQAHRVSWTSTASIFVAIGSFVVMTFILGLVVAVLRGSLVLKLDGTLPVPRIAPALVGALVIAVMALGIRCLVWRVVVTDTEFRAQYLFRRTLVLPISSLRAIRLDGAAEPPYLLLETDNGLVRITPGPPRSAEVFRLLEASVLGTTVFA